MQPFAMHRIPRQFLVHGLHCWPFAVAGLVLVPPRLVGTDYFHVSYLSKFPAVPLVRSSKVQIWQVCFSMPAPFYKNWSPFIPKLVSILNIKEMAHMPHDALFLPTLQSQLPCLCLCSTYFLLTSCQGWHDMTSLLMSTAVS